MPGLAINNSSRQHRLLSLIMASLLGCLLMAAITLPAGQLAATALDAQQYDRASGPLGEWLADELRNRPSLRTKTWTPVEPEDGPDAGDPLALLRAHGAGQAPLAGAPGAHPATTSVGLALASLTSPRGPPA